MYRNVVRFRYGRAWNLFIPEAQYQILIRYPSTESVYSLRNTNFLGRIWKILALHINKQSNSFQYALKDAWRNKDSQMLCSWHRLCLLNIVISSYPRWHQMSTKAQNTIILSSVTSSHLIEYWLVWPQAQIILVDHVNFFVMVFHLYKTNIGLKFRYISIIHWYLQTWM